MTTPRTILIVDDNEADQQAYRRTFKDKNEYTVIAALSAEAGLAALTDTKPDLILLDYNLPDMDGMLFMAKLADSSITIPIVMLTGEGDESLAVEAMKCGAEDYLVKHVDGRHLKLLPSIVEFAIQQHEALEAKNIAEQCLRESELRYRTLFDNALEGIAHCKMVYPEGQSPDFIYLDVNSAFSELTGLRDVVGKKVSEVIPGIQESNPELFEIYGRVALNGRREKFETFVKELATWFSVSVFQAEQQCFVAVFENITERKRLEQEMIAVNGRLTQEVALRTADLSALTAHIQNIAETERANLARELHDELGSTLVGISMEIGRLRGKINDPDRLQDLSRLKDLLTHAVQIKREVINHLYPTMLNDAGLVAAIEWQASEFRNRSGIRVELVKPEDPVDAEDTIALAAYRITQECLTNIAKHAKASKVQIEIKADGRFFDLTIHDNGKGLPGKINTGSHGIFGMIERARYLGGSMEIGSKDGRGTTAHLSLPLTAARM